MIWLESGKCPMVKNPKPEESFDTTQDKQKIQELENNWKRALADYQNLEKRIQSDRESYRIVAIRDVITSLLPVFETFRQASEHIDDQGLHLALKQLHSALERLGIIKIETVGKAFDPHTMDAIDTVESPEDGKVVQEVKSGYIYHDQVIVPVGVIVGKKKEEKENAQILR